MPSLDYVEKEAMAQCISPDRLIEKIRASSSQMLILDCRSASDFQASHISGSIHVSIPASTIMLRRLSNGKLGVFGLIRDNESRERFRAAWKTHTIVLYDTDSERLLGQTNLCILSTLFRRLEEEDCHVLHLQGGFNGFRPLYPEWCSKDNDYHNDSPLLGLENLRISTVIDVHPPVDSGIIHSPVDPVPFPVEILPFLFLGNAKNSCDLEALEKHKIRYILNVTPDLPNQFEQQGLGIKYMQIPIQDHWSQNLASFFTQAIAFIDEARQKRLGVLVHCLAGISRSVTITLAYLMHNQSMALNDAYDFVRRRKGNISPNFNFMGQLQDFERQLNLSPCHCTCREIPCKCQKLHFISPTRTTPDSGIHIDCWS